MAVALVRALVPHWENAHEYQSTFTSLLLHDDLDAVAQIIKEGLSSIRSYDASLRVAPICAEDLGSQPNRNTTATVTWTEGSHQAEPGHGRNQKLSHMC